MAQPRHLLLGSRIVEHLRRWIFRATCSVHQVAACWANLLQMCGLSNQISHNCSYCRMKTSALTLFWSDFQQHPALTSLNIERIHLGEGGARGLSSAVIRGLPLDGVSAYGVMGMMGAFPCHFRRVVACVCFGSFLGNCCQRSSCCGHSDGDAIRACVCNS